MAELLVALVMCVPLGIAAVASFITPRHVRSIVKAGVLLALGLVVLAFELPGDDGELDKSTRLAFGLVVAGVALLLWMIGIALGWAAGRTVRKARQRATPPLA